MTGINKKALNLLVPAGDSPSQMMSELSIETFQGAGVPTALNPHSAREVRPRAAEKTGRSRMYAPADLRDARRIKRIAAGNSRAFEKLYQSYYRRVFSFLYRMLSNREDAEEATNDVMTDIWRGAAARFRGDSRPSVWIFGIAHKKGLNQLRSRKRHTSDELDETFGIADPRRGPEDKVVKQDLANQALGHLSSEHRTVLVLAWYYGYRYHEVADIVGCPTNTVKTRVFHAKERLAKMGRRVEKRGKRGAGESQ